MIVLKGVLMREKGGWAGHRYAPSGLGKLDMLLTYSDTSCRSSDFWEYFVAGKNTVCLKANYGRQRGRG